MKITKANEFNAFKERTLAALDDEVKVCSPDTIIISDEHINVHLYNKEYLESFRRICEEFGDIQDVIIYLRRQDEFSLSMFSQSVKSGRVSISHLDNPLTIYKETPYRLNYLSILDNLSSVFGREKITPVIYNRVRQNPGSVVSDFLARVNIKSIPEASTCYEYNKSIDARIIKQLGRVSSLLKSANSRYTESLRKKIIDVSEKSFNGPGPFLSDATHAEFMTQFENQNKQVMQKYFPELTAGDVLFPDSGSHMDMTRILYPECSISATRILLEMLFYSLKSAIKHDVQ